MEKKILKGTAAKEQIDAWKSQYSETFEIKVADSVCYLKQPDRSVLKAVSALEKNTIGGGEVIIANCWLGGDDAIKTDNSKFMSVLPYLYDLIEIKEVELKKL
jgi:hypothetical protein